MREKSDNTFRSAAGEEPAALILLGNGDTAPAVEDPAGGYTAIECSDY